MSSSNETTIKSAIDGFLDNYNLKRKMKEMELIKTWGEITGKLIEKHTVDIYFKDKNLFVKLDSASVRQELSFMKSRLIQVINRKFEHGFIENIRVL